MIFWIKAVAIGWVGFIIIATSFYRCEQKHLLKTIEMQEKILQGYDE